VFTSRPTSQLASNRASVFLWLLYHLASWNSIFTYRNFALVTYWQTLSNFHNHQTIVSVTVNSSKSSDISCTWIPSFIYHDVFILVECFSVKRSPSVFTTVAISEHCTLDNHIFDAAKFTILTPLSLLISCKLSFPIVDVKIYSLPVFYWNLVIKYPGTTSEIDGIQALVTCKPTFRINNFILTWCTHMQHTNELLVLDMT